jgi:hypothetical protein
METRTWTRECLSQLSAEELSTLSPEDLLSIVQSFTGSGPLDHRRFLSRSQLARLAELVRSEVCRAQRMRSPESLSSGIGAGSSL